MGTDTEKAVRSLLKPTYDEIGWYRAVKTLDAGQAIPILTAILNDDREEISNRRQAALILGLLHDRRAAGELRRALNEASDHVLRGEAADALAEIGDPDQETVQDLNKALNDRHSFVRERAAKALGHLRRSESISALEQMSITDDVPTNREAALQAISAIRKAY